MRSLKMGNKFLNLKQVSEILNCSEKEVKDLMKEGNLPYYRIANQFIRFKEDEVLGLKRKLGKDKLSKNEDYEYTFTEKLVDFLYFNDFYILSILIIFLILAIIFLEVF